MITHARRRFMRMANSFRTLALCGMAAVCLADGLGPFESSAGAITQELKQEAKSDLSGPVRIRIERRGDRFTMLAGKPGETLTSSGPTSVTLHDPVYVGLAVCSHDANVLETAVFSSLSLQP